MARRPFTTALGVPASLYGALVRLRNRHYDRPGARERAGLPVISVGNVTVGGTGKTPIVAWLARRLLAEGRRPAIVTRGYRGRAGRGPLLASAGDGPLVTAEQCGDEPFLLASTLDGVFVIVGSDRLAGARLARSRRADVVILDDGFQHRRIERDLDVVLLDSGDPFGGGRLLPAGRLREPLDGLARAHVVLITRARAAGGFPEIEEVVRRFNRSAPILRAGHHRVGFVDSRGTEHAAPARCLLFCGIGNPANFRDDVEQHGVEVVGFLAWPDHHAFTAREMAELADLARRDDVAVVTTEKDLARIGDGWPATATAPLALRIEAEIFDADALLTLVRGVLS